MITSTNYYVYVHINPIKNTVFYVGKGKNNRAYSNKGRNIHWYRTVAKYNGFTVEIIKNNLSEEEACILEIQMINDIGIENLTNLTKGGEGGDTISNHPNKEEIIQKISISLSGENNPNYGGKFKTEEWIQKQIRSNCKQALKITDTINNYKTMLFLSAVQASKHIKIGRSAIIQVASKDKRRKKQNPLLKNRYLVEFISLEQYDLLYK